MSLLLKSFISKNAASKISAAAAATGSQKTYDLFLASTGEVRCPVEVASGETIEAAIEASQAAQQSWYWDYSPMERSKLLLEAARLLKAEDEVNHIAKLETLDTGRPLSETVYEAPGAADCLEWFAGVAPSVGGQHLDLAGGSFGYTRREPLGLTVGIGAWNYPLQSAIWKSAPSLAFGNSMIFKPSELTPQTALRLAEIYQKAGIPDGVFQVVLGNGPDVGSILVNDSRVNKVSFTGSVATGRQLNIQAASDFKKVTLEMGGKGPLILFDDTPMEQAVTAAMMANWYSSGQVCSHGTRVFVHNTILPEFLDRLVERTKLLQMGDPMDPTTDIGPMVSKPHMEKVLKYIDIGKNQDQATLLYGGNVLDTLPGLEGGYFMEPAIFADCTDDMVIVKEEIFGMVMAVLGFDQEDEVLERANATPYGLSAGVFTKDIQRAHRMVAKLDAGTTWINNYNLAPVELPWSGFKSSGMGAENGLAGIESWTKLKSVYVEMNEIESAYK